MFLSLLEYKLIDQLIQQCYWDNTNTITVIKRKRENTLELRVTDKCFIFVEDVFMSRSLDSTIKLYVISRAGKRKLPPYSRTERNIDVITPLLHDTTLTFNKASR